MDKLARLVAAFMLAIAVATVGVLTARPAAAASQLCTGFAGCSSIGDGNFGYSSVYSNSYWGQDGGHNCTNYVAYRFQNAGVGTPSWIGHGNADSWGVWAASITNNTPSVGAIAWWGSNSAYGQYSGHVSIVQRINGDGSFTDSDDNYGGDFHWRTYTPGASDWPSGFIHLNDAALGGGGGGGPVSVSASNNNGQLAVQLHNFPTGTTYWFCHTGDASAYPTGGSVPAHSSWTVSDPNQSFSSGLCSGSGNFWIGIQATDGHDYYSNQVTLSSAAASVTVSNNDGQLAVQLHNFPLGTTYWFCHAGDPSGYPTGGSIANHGSWSVGDSNQSWSSGVCAGSGNYWLGIQATDGHDYYSNEVTLGQLTQPSPPTGVHAVAGWKSAVVHWSVPSSDGLSPITGYTATASPGGASCQTASTSCVVTRLTTFTKYTFTVTASNAVGTSAASAASKAVAPGVAPSAPRSPLASPRNRAAVVSWTVPARNGGLPITTYRVNARPGFGMCTATAAHRTCTVAGLKNGVAYRFRVFAYNRAGSSAYKLSPTVVAGTTTAPRSVSAQFPAANQARISWRVPASVGSGPVISYRVRWSSDGRAWSGWNSVGRHLFAQRRGLLRGRRYWAQVVAVNGSGPGMLASVRFTQPH